MKHYTYCPSDYGSNKENEWRNFQLSFMKVPICDHREGRVGDDVTLYYQGFQQFIDNCNDIELSTEDLDFAKMMCAEMSEYFSKEKNREDAFADAITKYFEVDVVQSTTSKSVPDIAIGPNSCVIIEVKNESGQGGSDSHSQVIAYYVQSLEEKNPGQCPAPAYLIELVGPQLTISGAVFGRYVFVDKLIDPVWLVPHQRKEAMIRIARIFKALKEAIETIQLYHALQVTVTQPRFPIFQLFYKGNIQYEKVIKCHTFKGTLTYPDKTSQNVVVTFVKRYSHETHKFMDSRKYAPQLIHYEERVGGTQYTAIVMEYIPDAMPLDEFLKYAAANYPKYINSIKKGAQEICTKALKVLHDNKFCHGKISSKSILGKVQGKVLQIFIVNYEWAGRQGEATYPFSADIPEGVQPGYLITQDQDKDQLKKLFQELTIN